MCSVSITFYLLRILAFAAFTDISTQKIEALIRAGQRKDAALQRASRYFRHEKVINRGNEESKEASVCSIQADEACGSHGGAESELEEAENSILMKKRSTELWLSTQLRLLVDSDQTYRKIAGFINKHHGQVNRVLMKLPAESFSGNFGIQQSIQIPPRKVLINGTSFSAELCVRVKSKDSQRNKEIYEALHAYKKDIVEVESVRFNVCENFVIGLQSIGSCVSLRRHLGVQAYRQQMRCQVWCATSEVIEKCYYPHLGNLPENQRNFNVLAFLDGFGGMGYSRQSCALKISDIDGYSHTSKDGVETEKFDSASNVICEFVGDESVASLILTSLNVFTNEHWKSLSFKVIVVDHKAQHYVILVPGAGSKHKFTYMASLSTLEYANVKALPYYTYEALALTADGITEMWRAFLSQKYNAKLAELVRVESKRRTELTEKLKCVQEFRCYPKFSNSIVVPALFHAYTLHVSHYVLQAFAYGTNTTVRKLLDVIDLEFAEKRIHGMPYKTGDARRFISYAEAVYIKKSRAGVPNLGSNWENCMHLLALCNELQQILYCQYSPSTVSRFRVRVVTRLLAEAVARSELEQYLVQNDAKQKLEMEANQAEKEANKPDKRAKNAAAVAGSSGGDAGGVAGEGGASGSSTMATDDIDADCKRKLQEMKQSIKEKRKHMPKEVKESIEEKAPMMRHVYWPNLHIALPCIAERYPLLRINRLLEEAHEQSWMINTRFLAASRGRQDFRVMHKTATARRSSAAHRGGSLSNSKDYRYVDYRDIRVKRELVSRDWLVVLMSQHDYADHVIDEQDYIRFRTGGPNISKAGRSCVPEFSSGTDPYQTAEVLIVDF